MQRSGGKTVHCDSRRTGGWGQTRRQSAFFLETLRDASEEEPLLKACVRALETPEITEAIRAELDRMKIKPGDRVSFRVNGTSMVESENIRRWWREYRKRFAKGMLLRQSCA